MQKRDIIPDFPQELGDRMAALTTQDQTFLSTALSKEEIQVSKLLVAFATYARAYPHSSNWIHYDKKTIMYLAGLDKLRVADQQSLTNYLHEHYNLNMQVVGSTQPIPCFRFEWQVNQPRITTLIDKDGVVISKEDAQEASNPLIMLGPLTPKTISAYVEQTQSQKEETKD